MQCLLDRRTEIRNGKGGGEGGRKKGNPRKEIKNADRANTNQVMAA